MHFVIRIKWNRSLYNQNLFSDWREMFYFIMMF